MIKWLFFFLFPFLGLWAGISGDEALKRLVQGNMRYYQNQPLRPRQDQMRRAEVAEMAPKPFAVILGCSDSRVPPEIIFDQGLGDLYDVRVMGNIADETTIGSIEYSVQVEGTQFIMVLGHERCTTVKAALMNERIPGDAAAIIQQIAKVIGPVRGKPGNALDNAIRANVQYAVEHLKKASTILSEQVANRQLTIVGAIYDLDTGMVEVIE